jgi:hypothetical protein
MKKVPGVQLEGLENHWRVKEKIKAVFRLRKRYSMRAMLERKMVYDDEG